MSVMQQSSRAQDRTLGVWFQHIQQGMIKLPRFQRFEAWDRARVAGFLNTVIQNLPVGVTLLLQVGDKEQFVSRYVATAPETGSSRSAFQMTLPVMRSMATTRPSTSAA